MGLPSPQRVYRTPQLLLHPLGDFQAIPPPIIGWRILEDFYQLALLLLRKQRVAHMYLMAMISWSIRWVC